MLEQHSVPGLTVAACEDHLECGLMLKCGDAGRRLKVRLLGKLGCKFTKAHRLFHSAEPVVKLLTFVVLKQRLDALAHVGECPQIRLMH